MHWDDGPHASYDSAAYKSQLEATAGKPGTVARNDGDADQALATAAKTVTAQYYIPHLAHATMEPPSATARLADVITYEHACVCRTCLRKLAQVRPPPPPPPPPPLPLSPPPSLPHPLPPPPPRVHAAFCRRRCVPTR